MEWEQVKEFYAQHETAVQRWSGAWWASDGWHRLLRGVLGTYYEEKRRNIGWIFAAFAELPIRYQTVLELHYGIGCNRHTLASIGRMLPRDDYQQGVGVSGARVYRMREDTQRYFRKHHQLAHRWPDRYRDGERINL